MRYRIIAIGQLKRGFYQEGCDFYQKRLGNYAKFEVLERKEAHHSDANKVQTLEGEALLSLVQGYTIALDERGKRFKSRELADRVSQLEQQGISQISLLIGGAEGHGPALKERCDDLWSLSDLTLAHELARLMLLEQLYRIESIRAGHPYHRD
ncbi:MAG: 23S rRNA (pseudouridine(1915)-N(3))-methyltransferase RlmH [Deinococcales bacterium]